MCSFAFEDVCRSAFGSERGFTTLGHSSWAPAGVLLFLSNCDVAAVNNFGHREQRICTPILQMVC